MSKIRSKVRKKALWFTEVSSVKEVLMSIRIFKTSHLDDIPEIQNYLSQLQELMLSRSITFTRAL